MPYLTEGMDSLSTLPSELFALILIHIPTPELLPLILLSRRLHHRVLISYQSRLTHAASLDAHSLILECYPPSNKLSTSYLHCDYLSTSGLDAISLQADIQLTRQLKALRTAYSRYALRSQDRAMPISSRQRRPGDIPGSRTYEGYDALDWVDGSTTAERVQLDAGELFSQLCCVTNLVKMDPQRFLPLSIVRVSDGMIRVFRDWLARYHEAPEKVGRDVLDDVLWVNNCDNAVGLKLRVWREGAASGSAPRAGGQRSSDEDPVTYIIECRELVVRTSYLLERIEASREQLRQELGQGNAIVFHPYG